jgi:histidinol-phosphate aminotransferase
MSNELALARPEIIAMSAYSSARTEQQCGTIWLDANENAYSDSMLWNRYPVPQPGSLLTQLAALYQIPAQHILLTRGSDEGIDLLIRAFCRAGQDKVLLCPPTYGMYKVAALIQGAAVIEVPLIKESDFALDTTAIQAQYAINNNIRLIFLCSPNNPTGNLLNSADILMLCQQLRGKSIIVVDEAYIEFAVADSLIKNLSANSNLVILRTLSKAYGLAGARCGAVIANPAIIALLKKIIAPYPIPAPIVDIVCQRLLMDITVHWQLLREEREKLMDFIQQLPFVSKVWPSQTNFLLFAVLDAEHVMTVCRQRGIILRNRSKDFALANCIRVTIGTPAENKLLMEALTYV